MHPFLLQYLSFATQIIPVLTALWFSKHLAKDLLVFAYYLILSLVLSILNVYLALQRIPNLWVSNAFMPIEFGFLVYFFSFSLEHRSLHFAYWSIPSFVAMWAVCLIFEPITGLSTIARPIEGLWITIISCLVLLRLYRQDLISFARRSEFWIASGAMLYFASTSILFGVSNMLLISSTSTLGLAFLAEAVLNIITNLLYTRSFFCPRPR